MLPNAVDALRTAPRANRFILADCVCRQESASYTRGEPARLGFVRVEAAYGSRAAANRSRSSPLRSHAIIYGQAAVLAASTIFGNW